MNYTIHDPVYDIANHLDQMGFSRSENGEILFGHKGRIPQNTKVVVTSMRGLSSNIKSLRGWGIANIRVDLTSFEGFHEPYEVFFQVWYNGCSFNCTEPSGNFGRWMATNLYYTVKDMWTGPEYFTKMKQDGTLYHEEADGVYKYYDYLNKAVIWNDTVS